AAVGGGVHGHHVCCVGEVAAAGHLRVPVVYREGGQPAALGRDVQPVRARVVGKHVGVLPDGVVLEDLPGGQVEGEQDGVAVAGQDRPGVLVEDDHLVGVGGGGVDPAPVGQDQDAVHPGQVRDGANHALGVDVDLDDLPGAEVRDEQQSPARVQAGVVETGTVAGQRDRRRGAQAQRYRRRLVSAAGEDEDGLDDYRDHQEQPAGG